MGITLKEPGKLEKVDGVNYTVDITKEIPLKFIIKHIEEKLRVPPKSKKDLSANVLILKSGTGSGKSTNIPPALHQHFIEKRTGGSESANIDPIDYDIQPNTNSPEGKVIGGEEPDSFMIDLRKKLLSEIEPVLGGYLDNCDDCGNYNYKDKKTLFGGAEKETYGVLCTQPRVITTRDIPTGISDDDYYPHMKLGKNIGFQTAEFASDTMSENNGVKFVVLQILMNELIRNIDNDSLLGKYQFIMIDEAHERSVALDITLALLKSFMMRNLNKTGLPFVIITSATFDPYAMAKYFNVPNTSIISVIGSTAFDTPKHYENLPSNNLNEDIVKKVIKIVEENPNDKPDNCDVLIFILSVAEMTKVSELLTAYNDTLDRPFKILTITRPNILKRHKDTKEYNVPLNSIRVTTKKKTNVIPSRRIILGTNVVETGVTIETLRYVIDSGFDNSVEYNPNYSCHLQILKPAAQSMIVQRQGRVGRKKPGEFYGIYTKDLFEKLEPIQPPEILKTDFSKLLLDLIADYTKSKESTVDTKTMTRPSPDEYHGYKISDLDLLTNPSGELIENAVNVLYALGFVEPSKKGVRITEMGRIASSISTQTSVQATRMILTGFYYKEYVSIIDLVTIAAFLDTKLNKVLPKTEISSLKLIKNAGIRALNENIKGGSLYKFIDNSSDLSQETTQYLGGGDDINMYYQFKLLIADRFIEPLFVFYAFEKTAKLGMTLRKWCAEYELDGADEFMDTLERRDKIINTMITAGIDPFAFSENRLADVPVEKFMKTVTGLKKCIYEGFKLNLAVYDPNRDQYMVQIKQIPAKAKSMYSESDNKYLNKIGIVTNNNKPYKVLYNTLKIDHKENKDKFYFEFDRFSVIDGYYNIDQEFFY